MEKKPKPSTKSPIEFYFSFEDPYSWIAIERVAQSNPPCINEIKWMPLWTPSASEMINLRLQGLDVHFDFTERTQKRHVPPDVKHIVNQVGINSTEWSIPHSFPDKEIINRSFLIAKEGRFELDYIRSINHAIWNSPTDLEAKSLVGNCLDQGCRDHDADLSPVERVINSPFAKVWSTEQLRNAFRKSVVDTPMIKHGPQYHWGINGIEQCKLLQGKMSS